MKTLPKFNIRKTYEEVADYLREQIISGAYVPGARLPSLRELGETLGVGQSTVREALSSLKTLGLITMKQGEGTFVTRHDPEEIISTFESMRLVTQQEIIELLEVRKIIESGTARLAAERRTEDELKKIGEALAEMEQALSSEELGDQADWKFHYAVAAASHNQTLQTVMTSISEAVSRSLQASRQELYQIKGVPENLYKEHANIYEAIRERNGSRAEAAMLYHLQGVEEKMLD
ncbi:FadR/GntR family transcriptional regulator [Aneurinibacillus aneurinilyticus]|uniref:FadR family transcriptional regulator n=2 Tax=Aneurinibacillus aneurinilyticus TaxID=1391 RepID=A0A848D459_ANEAE|nr:FadR/GntR family transcriptional regulator [Aneurinibacillus aneurinilyticus]ERI10609.1 FCD domain protein [Aneurinibacillus aneurinilyticus ATCC 12856]MCI1696240.1 FadR family transcriptional regulator [Aneurinibacillus aneurinilyticus]MED0672160.1 FadR/GntR family transcriptional regulator [Aneurinibacillus aneurinilyticus]MED0706808.1 FadR/GntR family transcriptional regulator [Aneurinibacillus aneurinilyticus]MED0723806.1 FadR/GntR family transcriptional regulator [Aneurinibacillus aneu